MVPISPASITFAIDNQAITAKLYFDSTGFRRIKQRDTQLLQTRHDFLRGMAKTITIACRNQGQLRLNSLKKEFRRTVPTAMMSKHQYICPQVVTIPAYQEALYGGVNISSQQQRPNALLHPQHTRTIISTGSQRRHRPENFKTHVRPIPGLACQ